MFLIKKEYDVTFTYTDQDFAITSTAQAIYNERQMVIMLLHKVMKQNGIYNIGKSKIITSF